MKIRSVIGIICLAGLLLCTMPLFSAETVDGSAHRSGQLRFGADATVPVPLIMLHKDLWEVLAGPTMHYSLTDRFDVKATIAPAVHLSYFLMNNINDLGSQDGLAAVGLVEGGVRYYFSSRADSFFIDADAAAGFLYLHGDIARELFEEDRVFETGFSIPAVSLGYEFTTGRRVPFSLEAGLFALIPISDIEEFDWDITPIWPKVGMTFYF
ncbi:MAG: hypothetical protein K9K78_01585 [Spirochaetales bacterium]|nr:hypothetical protein [Spirochaetales bacterium]